MNDAEVIQNLMERQRAQEERLSAVESDVKQIRCDTADLIETFRSLVGGFKVLQWIGKAAKPLAYIAMLVGSVVGAIAAIKSGIGIK